MAEQKKETKATKRTPGDVVRAAAASVQVYANMVTLRDTGTKLASALRNIGNILGESDISLIGADGVTTFDANGTSFTKAADDFTVDNAELLALSVEVTAAVNSVKSLIENDLLEDDESVIARESLELWESVRGARKSPATSSRAQGERLAQPDFNFAIYSTCDLCGEVAVKGGERTNRLDWNSLRHYSQKHAIDRHGSNGFTRLVSDAWAEAKESFKVDGTDVVHVSGDSDMPGFTLERQA